LKYFGKYKCDDNVFWIPEFSGRAGIAISVISYGDAVRCGLNIDRAILPNHLDVHDLCKYTEDEVEKLVKAAGVTEDSNKLKSSKSESKG